MTRETPREDDEDDDDYRWIFLIREKIDSSIKPSVIAPHKFKVYTIPFKIRLFPK